MREEQKIWQQIRDTSSSISALAEDLSARLTKEHFSEQRLFGPTDTANKLAPKPLSAQMLNRRTPYTNLSRFVKLLADTAQAGYLKQDGADGYVITEKGAAAIKATNGAFYQHVNQVNQFPAEKLKELSSFIRRLVEASAKAGLPNGTFCFDISHNGHLAVEAGSLAQIDQHIDDLYAFRDDSHLASWMPSGLSGEAWEALTFVWNGNANTADELAEVLPNRNHTVDDYAKALADLAARGWLEPADDGYKITAAGKKVRDDAETATDNNFFGPWQALNDAELTKLGELISELNQTNRKITESNKAK